MAKCTVCAHPRVNEINVALAVETVSMRSLATQYDLHEAAIRRHKKNHLPKEMVKARQVQEGLNADDVWKQLKNVNTVTLHILREAREQRDNDMALKAVARVERQAELIMKLLGELDESPKVNMLVVNSPQWVQIRSVLVNALQPYPEARIAVAAALEQVEQ